MIAENGKTAIKISFPFFALITAMLLCCDEKVVLLCLTSSLFHECGHLIFMYIFGDIPSLVEFGVFGIRIEREQSSVISYKKEALIALGGILVNFTVALWGIIYYYIRKADSGLEIFFVNVLIATVNIIPAKVLDMGRAIKCLLLLRYKEEKAERIADAVSFCAVNIFAVAVIFYTLCFSVNISLIFIAIYLYIITVIKKWS